VLPSPAPETRRKPRASAVSLPRAASPRLPSAFDRVSSHSTGRPTNLPTMAALAGRKIFKAYNQDFIVDERWTVDKELGQGAYGIVW